MASKYSAALGSKDEEADNWLKIATLSGKMNDQFTNESASRGASALMKGEALPDGMSDSAINQAYLTAPRLEEGAVFEKKNVFMREAADKAKETGANITDILMNPPDHWFREPAGYKAYANIAKEISDANLASGTALKNYQAVGEEKFKQFDANRTQLNNMYSRGDMAGAANVLKDMINTSQIPYKVSDYDEKTNTLGMEELDIKNGTTTPSGKRVPLQEAISRVSNLGQQQFVAGSTMAAITAAKINRESLEKPQYYKDKSGGIYSGVSLINPGTLTDTVIHLRDDKTGKEIAAVKDPSKLSEMGFTPYDPKFEKDRLAVKHEELAIVGQGLQNRNLGAEGLLKRLNITKEQEELDFKRKEMAYKEDMWPVEKKIKIGEAENKSYELSRSKKEEQRKDLEYRSSMLEKALSGGGVFYGKQPGNKEEAGVIAAYGVKEMKNAKSAINKLSDMGIDNAMIPSIVSESMKRAADYISDDNAYADAINKSIAAATNKTPEEVELFGDERFRSLPYDEQMQLVNARISDKEQKKKDAEASRFSEKGNKTLSAIYSDIADEYSYLVKDRDRKVAMGAKSGDDDQVLMNRAISRYASKLSDAQGTYYPDISADEFKKKINLSVRDIQQKAAEQKADARRIEEERNMKKASRSAYTDSLAGY